MRLLIWQMTYSVFVPGDQHLRLHSLRLTA